MNTPTNGLPEKDFIQDEKPENPLPYWLWGFLLTIIVSLIWGVGSWYNRKIEQEQILNPFLQVTNRDFSLFLWQNSEFMRTNVRNKNGYLTGFQMTKVSTEPGYADEYVIAPPELLFLYHTWHRLLSEEFSPRPIPKEEFNQFIEYTEEWLPQNWAKAPEGYVTFMKTFSMSKTEDLSTLPTSVIPQEVRMAFEGWKNYFMEGDAINQVKPTYGEVEKFLKTHPHYARNYWRNILLKSYPKYLESLSSKGDKASGEVPQEELAPFFKVGFYNYSNSK